MQIILDNMCEKFHRDQLRNNRSLGGGKSDNKNKKNNDDDDDDDVGGPWRPPSGLTRSAWQSQT